MRRATVAAGTFLEGRVTYELMAEFCAPADQDPAATPTIVEFARIWVAMFQVERGLILRAFPRGELAKDAKIPVVRSEPAREAERGRART
jgi:hypothetical protein